MTLLRKCGLSPGKYIVYQSGFPEADIKICKVEDENEDDYKIIEPGQTISLIEAIIHQCSKTKPEIKYIWINKNSRSIFAKFTCRNFKMTPA
ncbi:MAG: hypothetical protein AAB824_00350 [Patescibacteria group bacterium]